MSLESSKQGTEDTVETGSVHTKTASPIHKEPYEPLKMDDPGEGKKYHEISTLTIDRLAGKIDRKLQELELLVKDDVKSKVRNLREDFIMMHSHVYRFSSDYDHFDAFEMFRKLDVLETLVNEDIRPKVKDIKEALERMYDWCYDDIPKVNDIKEDLDDELFYLSHASERYEKPGQTISEVSFNVQRNKRQEMSRRLDVLETLVNEDIRPKIQRDISGLDKKLGDLLIRMNSLTDEQQNKSQVDRKEGLTPDLCPAKSDAEEGNTTDKKPTDGMKIYLVLEGENYQNVDSCDGSTAIPSGDSSDDTYGRMIKTRIHPLWKAEWTIDPRAWNNCISSKDSAQIDALLRMKKIPNDKILSEAKNTFHIKYVRNICDGICRYIVQKSNDIRHVYPAIKKDESCDRSQESITFVVIHGKPTNSDSEFKLHIKYTDDLVCKESTNIKQREKEREIFYDENDTELFKLTNCMRQHSQKLMKGHTNICRISCSETKSVRSGKKDELLARAHCITIYVYAKGLIPLGEEKLPKTLLFEGYEALVDVQEGFVELYAGNEGPYDNLNHLRIGCSIGGDSHLNKENLHGTLGGFFDYAGEEFCMSSAHVFLSASEMVRLKEREKELVERNDYIKNVYQPHNVYHKSFGKGRMAVYTEGGNGKTGVDVLSILIENRNPNSGEFPKSERGAALDKTYSTGKVYNREDIHALLKKKNRVVMKYGCSTGWTTGTFRLDGAVFRAPHPVHDGDIQFNVCLHNQFEIQSDTENIFATKSDSGALVYMEDNDELVAIGMVVAGMADEVCFVTPLDEILEALGLDPKCGLKHFNSEVKKNASEDSCDSSYTRNTSLINDKETTLRSDLTLVSSDVESMKGDMNVLKQDVNDIRTDMGEMKRDMRDGFDAILRRLALGREPTDQ